MKILLTSIALAATVVAFPALAEPGCQSGNPLNDTKVSDCNDFRSGYMMNAPMTWYGSGAYIGYDSYAYVPQRRLGVRAPIQSDLDNNLNNETRLKGGAD